MESVFDIDLASNNLYSALFILAYERHNSSNGGDINRIQFGPASVEELSRCSIVFNPTSAADRIAPAPSPTATATATSTGAAVYNLSNFAQQLIPRNTRMELAGSASAPAAAATNTGSRSTFDDSFLPEQFLASRPNRHPPSTDDSGSGSGSGSGDRDSVFLETAARQRRRSEECSAAIEEQRTVFIETGTSQLAGILSPVLSAMAAPFIDEFNDLVTSWTMLDLEENFVHGMLGGIPPLVAEPLTFMLKRNITNLLSDSVTHGVTQRLAPTVANYISPLLTAMIADDVVPNVARGIHRAISDTIPRTLLL